MRPPSVEPSCQAMAAAEGVDELAARVVAVPVTQTALPSAGGLVHAGFGALLLFGNHTPAGFSAQLRALQRQAPAGTHALVMVDQEGGAIARMRDLTGPVPWPRTVATTMTPAQTRQLGRDVGKALRSAGVSVDLAPVLDLDGGAGPDARHPDGPRSYSADPATAASYALAFATGLADAGVLPVVKHFPGLGRATANTDMAPARVPGLDQLTSLELRPFATAIAAGIPAVMTSTAVIPGLSPLPAALAPAVTTGLLHDRMGFTGLTVTDSLSGQAVRAAGYDVPSAAVAALAAGNDLVLFGPDSPAKASAQAAAIRAAMADAVRSDRLARSRLVSAAAHVLAAAGSCTPQHQP